MKQIIYSLVTLAIASALFSCTGKKPYVYNPETDTIPLQPCPQFCADSAFSHIQSQCDFGPRVTGTRQSLECAQWIVEKFQQYGCQVERQECQVTLWDGKTLPAVNIIASTNPENNDRVLICSHWDSRPWADNDPDQDNHHTPVLAANDGASGVGVMLEIARLLQSSPITSYGVDFVCFDAEDMGTPQWAETEQDSENTWCLGSRYWSEQAHQNRYQARYGILLDMVGGRGSKFYMEKVSRQCADPVVQSLWQLARQMDYGQFFPFEDGGYLIDDHVNVNQIAGIPCLDIVPYFKEGPSSFGPTWHTVHDTPENIDTNVLEAVGQIVLQLLYNDI